MNIDNDPSRNDTTEKSAVIHALLSDYEDYLSGLTVSELNTIVSSGVFTIAEAQKGA